MIAAHPSPGYATHTGMFMAASSAMGASPEARRQAMLFRVKGAGGSAGGSAEAESGGASVAERGAQRLGVGHERSLNSVHWFRGDDTGRRSCLATGCSDGSVRLSYLWQRSDGGGGVVA